VKVTRIHSGVITTTSTAADAPKTPLTALLLGASGNPEEVYPESDTSSSTESSSSSEIVSSYASHASMLRGNSMTNIVSQTSLIKSLSSPRLNNNNDDNTPRGQDADFGGSNSGSNQSS